MISNKTNLRVWLWTTILLLVLFLFGAQRCSESVKPQAIVAVQNIDVNVSRNGFDGDVNECVIAQNPRAAVELFVACNHADGADLFIATSRDSGATWISKPLFEEIDNINEQISDSTNKLPDPCCDPTVAWDSFGNLYLAYVSNTRNSIGVLVSTNAGSSFNHLSVFLGSIDQPTIVAADVTGRASPAVVWMAWDLNGSMVASGASVKGSWSEISSGLSNFGPVHEIPGTKNCSFGDIAISTEGKVIHICQNPTAGECQSRLLLNVDPDGLGPNAFGKPMEVTTTNVGGFDRIPAYQQHSIGASASLVYDKYGRLYIVYTDEVIDESDDMEILLRYSDNDGMDWSDPPLRINDDVIGNGRSQFLPRIATDSLSGDVAICWYDTRSSRTNLEVQTYCGVIQNDGKLSTPKISSNFMVSDASSVSAGYGTEYGDYAGLVFLGGTLRPVWAATGKSEKFDGYTDSAKIKSFSSVVKWDNENYSSQPEHVDPDLSRITAVHAGSDSVLISVCVSPSESLVDSDVVLRAKILPLDKRAEKVPQGFVQFMIQAETLGGLVPVDALGLAQLKVSNLRVGDNLIIAEFFPSNNSSYEKKVSNVKRHTVVSSY